MPLHGATPSLCKAAPEHGGMVDSSTRSRPRFRGNAPMIKMKKSCRSVCPGSASLGMLCISDEGMVGLVRGKPHSKEHLVDLSLMGGGTLAPVVLPKWRPTHTLHQENISFSTASISSNFLQEN